MHSQSKGRLSNAFTWGPLQLAKLNSKMTAAKEAAEAADAAKSSFIATGEEVVCSLLSKAVDFELSNHGMDRVYEPCKQILSCFT